MTYQDNSSDFYQQEILAALDRCPEFGILTREEKLKLLRLLSTKEFAEGEQVFSRGDDGGRNFFIVSSGKFSIRLQSNVYKQCVAGDVFGEIAVFSEKHRLGTVISLENSKLIVFDSKKCFDPNILPIDLILNLFKALTKRMISYFYQEELLSSQELIRMGESESREFKESMSIAPSAKENIVRTLGAFMNLNGGSIFLGVKDDGTICGVSGENVDFDKYERDLRSLVNLKLGTYFNSFIFFRVEMINNKQVMRIDCDASSSPVFYKKENERGKASEEFVVRTGTCNTRIKKGREIIDYYQRRYKN